MFLGRDNPAERLLAILQSRTLAVEVIQALDLLPRLFARQWNADTHQWKTEKPPTLQDAVGTLSGIVSLTADRKGIVKIGVSSTDPALAASIANRYIEALQKAINTNVFSLARKNREFTAEQLEKTQEALHIAEESLKQFEQTHMIVSLETQTAAAVRAIADVERQIREREVHVGVQQRLMTSANREVYLLQEELRELRAQLAQLQSGGVALQQTRELKKSGQQPSLSLEAVPEVKMEYARLQREAVILGKVFTFLTQQLEQVKLEEARNETSFQVLDYAVPPERKSKPARRNMVLLGFFIGFSMSIVSAFFRNYLADTIHTAEQVEQQIGLTSLATLPIARPTQRRGRQRAAPTPDTLGLLPAATQAVRYLYVRFKSLKSQHKAQTVLIVGAETSDMVAAIITELAIVAANAGKHTLVLDSNVSQPAIHSFLHCASTPGLAEALAAPEQWQQSIQSTTIDCLHVVPAGVASPTTAAALASSAFETLLAKYQEQYDLILCTAPPVLSVIDAAIVGSKVDITCLVLTLGTSHVAKAREAKAVLEAVQADVLGAILLSSARQ
jgi:capsular exopolysaccharide synthesis family protein